MAEPHSGSSQPRVGGKSQASVGNIHQPRRVDSLNSNRRSRGMLGKLAGAWLGEKVAGRNSGAKGAVMGYGAAALARRSVPALATVTLGGWAFRKCLEHRRTHPNKPTEATPTSRSS